MPAHSSNSRSWPIMSNRLAYETSPYLLQHKDNPVDWYPWGEEALRRARDEDRPILLSVGYSACHWCHVMEHESFADPEIARLMNEGFVNIKVDREERPDVDAIYMQAVQQMTGHGGWPMTVFLTPQGAPFYGGTYFPPEPRHGLPSFRQILQAIGTAYAERRDEVERSATSLREALEQGMAVNPAPGDIDPGMLQRAFHAIGSGYDYQLGGFGGAPKFPQPMILDFLLRYATRYDSSEALDMVETTLTRMAAGGIRDHLGGGFHRYSVDARWLVPHFEKMLYDNALLTRIYLRAFQATQRADFRAVAEDTLAYVVREMRHHDGGFFSSQDADSEGVEGRFYVWSAPEIDEVLGEDGPVFRRFYDVSEGGNWEGTSILNTPRSPESVAAEVGISPAELARILEAGRKTLYDRRTRRIWPGRDEKVITSWNAMMLHAFAEAGRVLKPGYSQIAVENAEFILRELRTDDGIRRTWRDGTAKIDGFLEDHALLVDALLELYSATFEPRWVVEARAIADSMITRFWSPEDELFYDAAADQEDLIFRPRDIYDNATPSGTSAAVHALTRLSRYTGEAAYERIAGRVVHGMADVASRVPLGFGNLLAALSARLAPPSEVAIVGHVDDPDTSALLDTLRRRFLPDTVVALKEPDAPESLDDIIPLLAHRSPIDGRATAFVCRNHACRLPVTAPDELDRQLTETLAGM
jgi:uncharacterized protein